MKTILNDKRSNLKATILLSGVGLLLLGLVFAGCSGGKADKARV
jgi:hypothetical protein